MFGGDTKTPTDREKRLIGGIMETRLYLNLKKNKVGKHTNGSHWVEIKVDGVDVKLPVECDGRYYLVYRNFSYPTTPADLEDRVVEVTRRAAFEALTVHKKVVTPGHYVENKGLFRVEVVEGIVGGKIGILLSVTAASLSVLNKFWSKLVAGQLTPKHNYSPQK